MADYQIKWKQSDYIRLGKAVSEFNKKIRKLQQEEQKNYLPEEIDYNYQKERITTRKELNRYINSLRSFLNKGQENLVENDAGEQITKWEYNQLKLSRNRARKRLLKEVAILSIPDESGYSLAQMRK